jgi:enoyl-CoA hydratase/carnithine racemase
MDRTALAAGSIGEAFHRAWVRALNRLEDMPKVSLCVLHGYSIGGGLQIGLACDLRLAADDAVLGLGASSHGIIPDGPYCAWPASSVSRAPRSWRCLNEHVTPAAALAMGLINWVCPAAGVEAALASIIGRVREQAPTGQRAHQAAASRIVPPRPARRRRGRHGRRARVPCLVGSARSQPRWRRNDGADDLLSRPPTT